MPNNPFLYLALVLFLGIGPGAHAQDQHLIDSLSTALLQQKEDTKKADLFIAIATAYWFSKPDKAIVLSKQSMNLSTKLKYTKGIANACNSLGVAHAIKGNFSFSMDYFKRGLALSTKLQDTKGMISSYNNIANVYKNLGQYPEALQYHFRSLRLLGKTGDQKGIAISRGNIGNIYCSLGNYPEALKQQLASLKTMKAIANQEGIARTYGNVGNVCLQMKKYPEALQYYFAALEINKEIGDQKGAALNYGNIGLAFENQAHYQQALQHYSQALALHRELNDKGGICTNEIRIGGIHILLKNYNEARKYLNNALAIGQEIGSLQEITDSYHELHKLDSCRGNYKKALEHYQHYVRYRDRIFNNENTKKVVTQQMNYDFEKKQDALKTFQEKKDLIAQKAMQKQKLIRNGFMGGFTIVLLFAGVFFLQRNKIRKSKKRSDELLLNILPEEVAEELKAKGSADAKLIDEVTVLFTDFKGFTQFSEKLSPRELVDEINECFSAFDHIMQKHGVEKIKTIGDAYMAAGGLPTSNTTHAIDVVNAALDIQQYMIEHKAAKGGADQLFFEIRIGIHSGPVVAGIVGVKKFAYDIWGDTVNTASRMESSGEPGQINISETTYERVKNQFHCSYRGKVMAKGKGEIDMYFVEGRK